MAWAMIIALTAGSIIVWVHDRNETRAREIEACMKRHPSSYRGSND